MKKTKSVVFLDRDGTLIHEANYLKDSKDLKLFAETPEAIKKLNNANVLAIMVSNQSGIARGYFNEENVKALNNFMNDLLKQQGASLDGFYYCPHHPNGVIKEYAIDCNCRKPLTGMIQSALEDFSEIDLNKSYIIGDKLCDIELAHNAGSKSVLVKTGYGKNIDTTNCKPNFIANNLNEAVDWILNDLVY